MKEKIIFLFLFAIVRSLNNGLQKVNVCDMAINKLINLHVSVAKYLYTITFDVYM